MLTALAVFLKAAWPYFAIVGAWLAPSPVKSAAAIDASVQDAEKKADNGDTTALDRIGG